MPVKSENYFKLDITDDDWISDYTTEFVLSDDIWNKFELPNGDSLSDIVFSDLDIEPTTISSLFELSEIRNHDCMWAGHCGSKEHPADEFKPVRHIVVPGSIQQNVVNAPAKPAVPTGSRSLLLKTQSQQNVVPQTPIVNNTPTINANPVLTNLESPPNSDDEEPKIKTEVLQILQEAISEYDLEEDSDLCEYFEEDVEDELLSESAESNQQQSTSTPQSKAGHTMVASSTTRINVAQFTSDHCYHKDKNASMRMNNLGIETPSDSEEEIDVVSVGEKQTLPTRMVCTLPNNPSRRDKQHIQRTMASAINKNGIKTLLPRKPSIEQSSPVKRRVIEHRGMKRSKHRSSPTSPYKKRSSYNHSSDSEPEPSEKRNLHNNMERQRRIDLRNAFEDLRCLVPEVSKRERAPKVVILREAALYCDSLGNHSDNMHRQVDELRRQQRRLRARVSHLRLSLAAKHR